MIEILAQLQYDDNTVLCLQLACIIILSKTDSTYVELELLVLACRDRNVGEAGEQLKCIFYIGLFRNFAKANMI